MRSLSQLALSAALCASCQSVELKVAFAIPTDYQPEVGQLRVALLTPPGPETNPAFDCDTIAYGLVAQEQLNSRQDSAWTFPPHGSFSLGSIPRSGTKLFTVEGVSPSNTRIVAGCGQVDTLTQATELEITAYPVVHATVDPPTVEFDASSAMPQTLTVAATDALGHARTVPFRYGVQTVAEALPAGLSTDGRLEVARPAMRGPFTVTIFPAWSADRPLPVAGMFDPQAVELHLPATLLSMRAGRFLANGGAAAAVLVADGAGRHLLLASGNPLVAHPVADIDGGQQLLAVREPRGQEALFAVGDVIYRIADQAPATPVSPLPADLITDIFPVDGQCDGSQVGFVFNLQKPDPQLGPQFLDLTRDAGPGHLLGAGCITPAPDGGSVPAVVLDAPAGEELRAAGTAGRWWGVGGTAAFTALPGQPRQLVGVEAVRQAFDVLIAQPVIEGGMLTLTPTGNLGPIPQPPAHLVTGDFDGNQQLDIAALLTLPGQQPGMSSYAVFVVMQGSAVVAGGIGLGPVPCVPEIDVANLFGGPGDELIVGFRGCNNPSAPTLRVYSFE